MPSVTKTLLAVCRQGHLNDYVTAIAWSPNHSLAIASAAGEILLVNPETQAETILQEAKRESIDCLAFSADGHYLAAGGQSGQLLIWPLHPPSHSSTHPPIHPPTLLSHPRTWLDRLTWSPTRNELAFSLGRYAQVWDAAAAAIATTLQFENSSILDLAWHPQGKHLAVSGHQGVKIWPRDDWDADPEVREMAAASVAIAFSPNGQYLASGNLDQTLLVWPFESAEPWQMRGFPGKVRQLAWSNVTVGKAPLLATASGADVIVWRQKSDASNGWDAQVLDLHEQRVNAIAFQPGSTLLASAAEDGQLCLWQKAQQVAQILEGATQGFSTLAWSPNGKWLAAGGQQGEWLLWKQSDRGRGFG
ncbi:MAG: WD40 repeat domain-containing protein [Cyanobacteria bacterium J06638_28]